MSGTKTTAGTRREAAKAARRRPAPTGDAPADRGGVLAKKPRRSKWSRRPKEERLDILDAAEAAVVKLAEALYGKRGRGWLHATLIIDTRPKGRPDFIISFPTPRELRGRRHAQEKS